MRVVIAPDKFKGSASVREMAEGIASALKEVAGGIDAILLPVADGGQGSLDALSSIATNIETRCVEDAWGEPVNARAVSLGDETWVEMSETAGVGSRTGTTAALAASSRGTGLLLDRLRDASRVVVSVGGTLSSDGGTGLASALGWRFLDAVGDDVPPGGGGLERVARIVPAEPPLYACVGACDVMAPLLGPRGAARRYAPQKGADEKAVDRLETGLAHLADLVDRDLGRELTDLPGAGAGGGTGLGLAAFLGATLERGFDLIASRIGLEDAIASADLVITGEGAFDEQTLEGKAPFGVLGLADRYGVPCALVAGRIETDARVAGFATSTDLTGGVAEAVKRVMAQL